MSHPVPKTSASLDDPVARIDHALASVEPLLEAKAPDEVRRDAWRGLSITSLALVMGVVGVVFDGWWPWAPVAVLGAVAIVPMVRMLRTRNPIHSQVDPGKLARQVLEASWPEADAGGASLAVRTRIQELADRLPVEDDGRLPALQRLLPWSYVALGVTLVGMLAWVAFVAEGSVELPFLVLVAALLGGLAMSVRFMLRRNDEILRAAALLDDLLRRLAPPPS